MLKWMTRAVLDYYVQFVQKFNKLRSCLVKKLKLRLFFFLPFSSSKSRSTEQKHHRRWKPIKSFFSLHMLVTSQVSFDAFVSFAMFFFLCIFPCVCFLLISCDAVCHIEAPAFHSCSCCLAQFRRWFFLHLYQRQCVVDRCYQLSSKFLSQRGLYSLCYCKFTAGLQSAVLVRYSLRSHTFKTYSFSR